MRAGRVTEEEATFIPESERHRVYREARAWIAVYAVVVGRRDRLHSLLPLMYVGLPTLYGRWLSLLFGVSQHAGLAENVLDHRLNARTIRMNPVFRFIYWNMNYHVEHHMFPMVPYHALPQLHAEVADDLPAPYPSLFAAYREIVPTLWRQQREPDYYVRRELPPAAQPFRPRCTTPCSRAEERRWSRRRRWVDVCAQDDIDEEDVISVEHDGRTFAIYRSPENTFHATDAICTHERAHLADGLVMGDIIECPKHNGRFNYKTGEATRVPARVNLCTYPVKTEAGRVFVKLG